MSRRPSAHPPVPGPAPAPGGAGEAVRLVYVSRLGFTHWQFLRGQNPYLRARGFELHALAGDDAYLRALRQRDGVHCHPVRISPRALAPLRDLWAVWRIYRLLRRIRPHIVHLSAPKPAALGAVAAWLAGVPVRVYVARGSATATAAGPLRRLWRTVERLTARLCTDAVVVSPSLRAFLHREGILAPGIGFVPAHGGSNGVDARRFSPGGGPPPVPAVGHVGRLARGKGIEQLAAAWLRVRQAVPGARLVLVGRWDDDHPVAPACRAALEADPRVEVHGHVEDVVPYLRTLSVAVFPSRGEGMPNAVLEAQAVGVAVVASRVVGMVDAVEDGVTGTLVPPGDAVALADAVIRYLQDDGLRRRHGSAGRSRVLRCFGQEPIWRAMHAHYLELAGRGGRRGIASDRGGSLTGAGPASGPGGGDGG